MNEEIRLENFLSDIKGCNQYVFKIKDGVMSSLKLKPIHSICLFYLHIKGDMTSKELVKLTLEDKAAISKAIKKLEDEKIVIYDSKYNGLIKLTLEGKKIAENVYNEFTKALKEARKGISDEEAKIFADTLKKLHNNLKSYYNEDF